MLKALLISLRPKQWVKNLLVFIPLVFARKFLESDALLLVAAAFGIFSLATSGIYLINDVFDREKDALHPIKKLRPIASGKLSPCVAIVCAIVLLTTAISLAWIISTKVAAVLLTYLLLQLAYSAWLKHLQIIDLIVIGMGFVLRVLEGSWIINVEASGWLLTLTFLLAILLATGKRMQELQSAGVATRKVLENYNLPFLQSTIQTIFPAILVSYLFYSIQTNQSSYFLLTIPFVFYGLLRYLFLLNTTTTAEDPTELFLTDKPMLFAVLLWGISVMLILAYA